jgi:hypothetical protein
VQDCGAQTPCKSAGRHVAFAGRLCNVALLGGDRVFPPTLELAAEYEVKIAKLEAELKAKAAKYETANDIEVQKFAVHFENFQNEFNALAGSLNNLRERDGNTSAKLLAGLRRVLEQMRETLGD